MDKKLKNFSLIFILITLIFSNIVNAQERNFSDIENHWASEYIEQLIECGIVSGYPDGSFKPDNNITINEFLKIIIIAGDYSLVREGNNIYPDFYVATAKKQGLINNESEVDMNKYLTRYEMVDIISNFVGVKEVKTNKNIFKDLNKENKDNVLKLVKLKIINGYEDKTFRGENNITRAEVASVICKTLENRERLISKRKYSVDEKLNLSNYIDKSVTSINTEISSVKTFYEIDGSNIKIYDFGRYAVLNGYEISKEIINTQKIIKIIEKLINEKAYVGVIYAPSKYTIGELKILYGKEEQKVLCGEYDFGFHYYEDKLYKLATKSLHKEFSDNCYLRIDVIKLWDDYSEYKKGQYVDEYKKEKLLDALNVEFGNSSEKILEYMINKNIKYVTNVECDREHIEQKTFGKYIVNYYQKEYGVPQFYIERK